MTSPIPDVTNGSFLESYSSDMSNFWMQLTAISLATEQLFLGTAGFDSEVASLDFDGWVGQPSFLEIQAGKNGGAVSEFIWGDVLNGIEEMSHNVTAALLTLNLGNMSAECDFDQEVVVYQYSSFALWVPYGVSHFSLLLCYDLIFSPNYVMFYRRPWALFYFHLLLPS